MHVLYNNVLCSMSSGSSGSSNSSSGSSSASGSGSDKSQKEEEPVEDDNAAPDEGMYLAEDGQWYYEDEEVR